MGIQGLLPQLRSITCEKHVREYKGKTIAVDSFCWLHRAAYTCAREVVENEPTRAYVDWCIQRAKALRKEGIRVIMVFDGGNLPAKHKENHDRSIQREDYLKKARMLWCAGNFTAAVECYQRAVSITAEMCHRLILELRKHGIEYMVAPYEADAQMTYLVMTGIADAVLTEDSDLLAYGCPRVLFKLDPTGVVHEVLAEDLPRCRELDLRAFNQRMFLDMCIMSGCDFLDSPKGVGIKKAHQSILRWKTFPRACKQLRFSGVPIPQGYEAAFQRAVWTFRHQRVFCPRAKAVVHLFPLVHGALAPDPDLIKLFRSAADSLADCDDSFLGPPIPDDVARAIVRGDLHPHTHRPFPEIPDPLPPPAGQTSLASFLTLGGRAGRDGAGAAFKPPSLAAAAKETVRRAACSGGRSELRDTGAPGQGGLARRVGRERQGGSAAGTLAVETKSVFSVARSGAPPQSARAHARGPRVVSRFFRAHAQHNKVERSGAAADEIGPESGAGAEALEASIAGKNGARGGGLGEDAALSSEGIRARETVAVRSPSERGTSLSGATTGRGFGRRWARGAPEMGARLDEEGGAHGDVASGGSVLGGLSLGGTRPAGATGRGGESTRGGLLCVDLSHMGSARAAARAAVAAAAAGASVPAGGRGKAPGRGTTGEERGKPGEEARGQARPSDGCPVPGICGLERFRMGGHGAMDGDREGCGVARQQFRPPRKSVLGEGWEGSGRCLSRVSGNCKREATGRGAEIAAEGARKRACFAEMVSGFALRTGGAEE